MGRRDEEHQHQKALFEWAAHEEPKHPALKLLHAIPNGGHRHKAVAGRMKAEGVKPGVADIFLPVAKQDFHGLYIEMKATHGALSKPQLEFANDVMAEGYAWVVSRSWVDAAQAIANYLNFESRFLP